DLVELGGEDLVIELVGELGAAILGGRGHGGILARLGLGVLVGIGHVGLHALDIAGFLALAGLAVLFALGLLVLAIALLGRLVGTLGLLGLVVLAAVLVALGGILHVAFGDQVEIAQHGARSPGEILLALIGIEQLVERGAGLGLDLLAPEIDQRMARRRHGHAGQLFAQHEAQGLGQRRIALVVDLREIGAEQPVLQHFMDIAAHAGHADDAEGLDARLFQRVEGSARLRVHGAPLAMGIGIMAGQPHGHGIALP